VDAWRRHVLPDEGIELQLEQTLKTLAFIS